MSSAGPAMRLQQMLRGQRLPPIPHLLSVMVQPKQVSKSETARDVIPEWSMIDWMPSTPFRGMLKPEVTMFLSLRSHGSTLKRRGTSCSRMR